jgi:hypothetical protein
MDSTAIPATQYVITNDIMKIILGYAISSKTILSLTFESLSTEFLIELYDYYSNYGKVWKCLNLVNSIDTNRDIRHQSWKTRIFELCEANPRLYKVILQKMQSLPLTTIVPSLEWQHRLNCPPLLLYGKGELIVITDPSEGFRRKGRVICVDDQSIDVDIYDCVRGPSVWYGGSVSVYRVTTMFETIVKTVTITNDNVEEYNPCQKRKYTNSTRSEGHDVTDDGTITLFRE